MKTNIIVVTSAVLFSGSTSATKTNTTSTIAARPLIPPFKSTVKSASDPELGNIQIIASGVDCLEFSIWSSSGAKNQIFEITYNEDREPVSDRMVPDGYDLSTTTYCSFDAATETVSGAESCSRDLSMGISIEGSHGGLAWDAKFQSSVDFERSVERVENGEEVLSTGEMSCETFQVRLQQQTLPNFTMNFLKGVFQVYQGALEGVDFVRQFGTHYFTGAGLGSKIRSKFYSKKEDYQELSSSSLDIKVGAAVTTQKVSGASELHTATQASQAEYFESFVSEDQVSTIGAPIPARGDLSEAEWLGKWSLVTRDDDGLNVIDSMSLKPLEELFDARYLEHYQPYFAEQGIDLNVDGMHRVQHIVMESSLEYCLSKFPGAQGCPLPNADYPLPPPFPMMLKQHDYYEMTGQIENQENAEEPTVADILGGAGELSPDVQLVQLQLHYCDGDERVCGMGYVYFDASGKLNEYVIGVNTPNLESCKIDTRGERVKQVNIYGSQKGDGWVAKKGLRAVEFLLSDDTTVKCQHPSGDHKGLLASWNFLDKYDRFLGFNAKANPNQKNAFQAIGPIYSDQV